MTKIKTDFSYVSIDIQLGYLYFITVYRKLQILEQFVEETLATKAISSPN